MNERTAPSAEEKLPSEQAMRRAIDERDRGFDGVFVYGVITTGVFCRPSCGSRRARPANLRFFVHCEAARAAGFRACRRCHPAETQDGTTRLMQSLAAYIETHADRALSLKALAHQAQMSPAHLQRTFKTVLGVSPKSYHDAARLRLLKGSLRSGKSVIESITEAGFQSTSRIYGHATRNLGMTPSSYRSGGAGENIAYAFRATALGPVLMAATARGLCFAQFGESEHALVAQLAAEFPRASVVPSAMQESPQLDSWIEAFDRHIAGMAPRPDVSLDLRGTLFQIRVWKFLLGVPEGEVMSYTQIAAGVGTPRAVRATASACAANRIAVLVPCHRVLRADGALGGYRWGLERKRALIERERAQRAAASIDSC